MKKNHDITKLRYTNFVSPLGPSLSRGSTLLCYNRHDLSLLLFLRQQHVV